MLNAGNPRLVCNWCMSCLSEHKESGDGDRRPSVLSRLRDTIVISSRLYEHTHSQMTPPNVQIQGYHPASLSCASARQKAWRPGQAQRVDTCMRPRTIRSMERKARWPNRNGWIFSFYDLSQVVAADATMRLAADSLRERDAAAAIRHLILRALVLYRGWLFRPGQPRCVVTQSAFLRRHLDLESIGENLGWKTIEKLLVTSDDVYGVLDAENPRE